MLLCATTPLPCSLIIRSYTFPTARLHMKWWYCSYLYRVKLLVRECWTNLVNLDITQSSVYYNGMISENGNLVEQNIYHIHIFCSENLGYRLLKKNKKEFKILSPIMVIYLCHFYFFLLLSSIIQISDMYAYLSNPDYIIILFLSEGILGRKSLSPGGYNGGLMSSFGV